jgi:hypothetical protein
MIENLLSAAKNTSEGRSTLTIREEAEHLLLGFCFQKWQVLNQYFILGRHFVAMLLNFNASTIYVCDY